MKRKLRDTSLALRGIDQEVEKKLVKAQSKKKFKDAGERVAGSKKEKAAYRSLIASSDLSNLEKDAITASEMVIKDKVYPPVVVENLMEGNSSGAAFLKVEFRKAMAPKPANNQSSRRAYVAFIERLVLELERCRTVEEVAHLCKVIMSWKGHNQLIVIDPNIISEYSEQEATKTFYDVYETRVALKALCGIGFYNLLSFGSGPAREKWTLAGKYEGVTQEQEEVYWELHRERANKNLVLLKDKVRLYRSADTSKLKELRGNWRNLTSKGVGEEFRNEAIQYYDAKITTAQKELETLPDKYKKSDPDWSWSGKKVAKKSADTEKTDITVNSGVKLTHIKRIGGLEITDVSEKAIRDNFGFKYVEFGNSISDQEAAQHVRNFLGACADMFEMLGFDAVQVNQLGGLSIAFASRGHGSALATYYPSRKIINITKNRGDGTVCHEWGHYIDNVVFELTKSAPSDERPYGSENITLIGNPAIRDAYKAIATYIQKGDGTQRTVPYRYYRDKSTGTYRMVDQFDSVATLMDALKNKYPAYLDFDLVTHYKYGKTYAKRNLGLFGYVCRKFDLPYIDVDMTMSKQSLYYYYSSAMKSPYWSTPREMFARAYETYMYDKLAKQNRSNNYLVSGGSFVHPSKVYPFGQDREELFKLYDSFFTVLQKELKIGVFKPFTDKRTDEYIAFDAKQEVESVKVGLVTESTSTNPVISQEQRIRIAKAKAKALLLKYQYQQH